MEHIHIQMDSQGRLAALNGMISSTTKFTQPLHCGREAVSLGRIVDLGGQVRPS